LSSAVGDGKSALRGFPPASALDLTSAARCSSFADDRRLRHSKNRRPLLRRDGTRPLSRRTLSLQPLPFVAELPQPLRSIPQHVPLPLIDRLDAEWRPFFPHLAHCKCDPVGAIAAAPRIDGCSEGAWRTCVRPSLPIRKIAPQSRVPVAIVT
jgi:hypothetical protein